MDGSSASAAELAVPLKSRAPLSAVWGADSALHAFPRTRRPLKGDAASAGVVAAGAATLTQVRWRCHAFRPTFRKLISESHQYFLQVQEAASRGEGPDGNRASLLKFSRLYRAVMKTCAMELQRNPEDSEAAGEAQLLELQELIWSLVEILFIDSPSTAAGGLVLDALLEWIHRHFPTGERRAPLILEDVASLSSSDDGASAQPEASPHFWPAVLAFVLQGQLDRAREVLALHSAHLLGAELKSPTTKEALDSADELLRKMPLFNAYVGKSVTEFDLRWQRWREECQLRLAKGVFVEPQLELMVRILTGDEDAFNSNDVLELTSTWYHHLVSKLLYTNPTVKLIEVQYHIHQAIDSFMIATGQTPSPVDGILQAAFEFDLHSVVKDCCSHLPNWWMAAHLTDLLHHCGQLDPANETTAALLGQGNAHFRCSLREHILLEYAEGLTSHGSLWQLGLSYLDHCPRLGRQHQGATLDRLPVDSEAKALKALGAMRKRGFNHQGFSLCRVLATRALKRGRLGSALSWAIESKDVGFASFVAETLLTHYSETGSFSHLDILDHLGSDMVLSDKLAFLGKYREFHLLYESSSFAEAGRLLLSLLTAELAPKRFWLMLLLDALPLLEAADLVFGVDDTYELMHCLEEWRSWKETQEETTTTSTTTTTLKSNSNSDLEEDKTSLLRLALARNLARAMVEPKGDDDHLDH